MQLGNSITLTCRGISLSGTLTRRARQAGCSLGRKRSPPPPHPNAIYMHSWPGRCKNRQAAPELEMVTDCCLQLLGFRVLRDTGRLGEGSPAGAEQRDPPPGASALAVPGDHWAPSAAQGRSRLSELAEELIWAMHRFARLAIQIRV